MRAVFALLLGACGSTTTTAEIDLAPADMTDAECAVCGMVVGEQPAPRGQVIYRDGTHLHTCSIADLRALVQAPSSRGTPTGVYVEGLEASFDVATTDLSPRPWITAEDAWFVFGATRPMVMGLPILTFADEAAATQAATALSGSQAQWDAVSTTPFNEAP
jgi:nitrous oxide reductase accessory protein NosL